MEKTITAIMCPNFEGAGSPELVQSTKKLSPSYEESAEEEEGNRLVKKVVKPLTPSMTVNLSSPWE